jgi:hypothetical protein
VVAAVGAIDFGGDDDFDIAGQQDINDAFLGIIGAVGEQGAEAADDLGQQGVGPMKIMKVSLRQVEGDRVAERITQCVQLAAQSAFAAADRFCFEVPPFAPALA